MNNNDNVYEEMKKKKVPISNYITAAGALLILIFLFVKGVDCLDNKAFTNIETTKGKVGITLSDAYIYRLTDKEDSEYFLALDCGENVSIGTELPDSIIFTYVDSYSDFNQLMIINDRIYTISKNYRYEVTCINEITNNDDKEQILKELHENEDKLYKINTKDILTDTTLLN